MVAPVNIFIDGQELIGYTSMRLKRAKKDMTGSLTLDIFMGYIPAEPVLPTATTGRKILVYIARFLAFTGYIDRRIDASSTQDQDSETENSIKMSVGANSYSVTFTCRGETKYLIDSSQQHPTGTMLRPTSREAFETLIAPWQTQLSWEADSIQLDKLRFRDGGFVSDELQRIAEQCSLYMFEGRDGQLRVLDGPTDATGEDLILGVNIIQFSADQAVNAARDIITVKGQRIEQNIWGIPAVLPTIQGVRDLLVEQFVPITVQLFGNGTDELLQRRGQYEANRRSAIDKTITMTVFHIQQTNGQPWDIAVQHYIEIPPAGIYGFFEVTEIEYVVDNDNKLETILTFSPPPVNVVSSASGTSDGLSESFDDSSTSIYESRALQLSRDIAWNPPELELGQPNVNTESNKTSTPLILNQVGALAAQPPLELPASFVGAQ